MEQSPAEYVAAMVAVMREVRRVLRDDGTLWLNVGDTYAADRGGTTPPAETLAGGRGGRMADGSRTNRGRREGYNPSRDARAIGFKHKDLIGIPWRLAFALQDDGWYLRSDIVWAKPNPMPESVTDRPTRSHEHVFLLAKSERYFYDRDAIREHGGRNARDVWTIAPEPFADAHFATMPPELARRCILAGSRKGDVVLDPFGGAGTTALAALQTGRRALLCELNAEYVEIQRRRLAQFDFDTTSPVRAAGVDCGPLFAGCAR
jgi:site-specific DNA-methyltransferase (adenine-specific)